MTLVLTAPRNVADTAIELGLPRCLEVVVEELIPSALKLDDGRHRVYVAADGYRNGLRRPAAFVIDVERARSQSGRYAMRPISIRRSGT